MFLCLEDDEGSELYRKCSQEREHSFLKEFAPNKNISCLNKKERLKFTSM